MPHLPGHPAIQPTLRHPSSIIFFRPQLPEWQSSELWYTRTMHLVDMRHEELDMQLDLEEDYSKVVLSAWRGMTDVFFTGFWCVFAGGTSILPAKPTNFAENSCASSALRVTSGRPQDAYVDFTSVPVALGEILYSSGDIWEDHALLATSYASRYVCLATSSGRGGVEAAGVGTLTNIGTVCFNVSGWDQF
jgi:hypothetical protein